MPDYADLTLRQTIEGMTLVFNAEEAGDLEAVIQFQVTGDEPGAFHLKIARGGCTFHLGQHESPTLTIHTPSQIWQKIGRGELSGQDALMQRLYKIEGDGGLLLRMNSLFSGDKDSFLAPPGQRPAGPVPLSGMAWMTAAFVPWILFWIAFELFNPGIGLFLPWMLSIIIAAYRAFYRELTVMEGGSLGFFTMAVLLFLFDAPGFYAWGSAAGSAAMGGLWFGSMVWSEMPLSGQYSKWKYHPRLWPTSLFIHPNAVISLMWGWQFQAAALLGLGASLDVGHRPVLTAARFLLLVPAFVFTIYYQQGAAGRRVEDIDGKILGIRKWAAAGVAAAVVVTLVSIAAIRWAGWD